MADNTIDTLDIQIKSDTRNATKSLSNLVKKLSDVDNALGKVNTGGMRTYSREIGRVSAALKALSGTKVSLPNLTGLTSQLRSLSKIDFTALQSSSEPLKNLASGLNSIKDASGASIPESNIKNIKSAVDTINKFQSIDAGKMQPAIDGVQKIHGVLAALNGIDFKDSKITTVINAIKRLVEVDMSSFDTGKVDSIVKSVNTLSEVGDISNGVNRIVSSLSKLSNAGEKTNQTSSGIANLGRQLKKSIKTISKAGNVSESVNMFVQSIGRLANAGGKTGKTASELKNLAVETKKFFEVMKDAPQISENTIRMTEALGQLAAAGGKVGTATNTVSNSFNKLSSVSGKLSSLLGNVAGKAKSGIGALVSGFSNLIGRSGGLKTASFNVGSFIKTVLGFKAASAVMSQFNEAMEGKGILEIGSDITEVENVVDTAFGSMANQAYEFASTATQQYGLSELAAKNYAGTMMAMLKSSGVAQKSAAKMSTTLAGLAGDLASFYNIDTDTAFYKLRSGMSGEIEPLKQLGINLSVANLEAYALSQGITTSYKSMDQAEKTMLRYNYILSVTGDQQGDFAKTSGTWANQVRLLTLNIQSLSAVIGQGLITAVLPAIKVLNALMSKLMQAANAFRNFMYALTGNKLKGSTSGVVNDLAGLEDASMDLSSLEDAGDDASTGMKNASKSAKNLKKSLSLLPYDELNVLTKDLTNASNSGTKKKTNALGLDDTGLDDLLNQLDDALTDEETPVNKWAERIRKAFLNHDWKGLGKAIADMINAGMKKVYNAISWKKVGPKITKFCKAFTETFNSLVDNIDWDLMGRTIGAGINTLVNTFELLIGPNGIDFVNIGNKLATGLRGMLDEVNWTNLGQVLGSGFMISWDILNGFVTDMSQKNDAGLTGWEQLGDSIANTLNGIFDRVSFKDMAHTAAVGINGIFSSLNRAVNTFNWDEFTENLKSGISEFLDTTDWKANGEALGNFVSHLCEAIQGVMTEDNFEKIGEAMAEFLQGLPWGTILYTAALTIRNAITGLLKGMATTPAGRFAEAFAIALTGATIVAKITKAFKTLFGNSASKGATEAIELLKAGGVFAKFASAVAIGAAGGTWFAEKSTAPSYEDELKSTEQLLSNFQLVLEDLKEQGIVSGEAMQQLYEKVGAISENTSPAGTISLLRDALVEAGVSSDQLATSMSNTSANLNELYNVMANSTGSIDTATGKTKTLAQAINDTNTSPLIEKLNSLQSTTDQLNFSNLIIQSSNAIDQMGGIWENGKQILGDKAIAIYQAIQNGLKPDENGFYNLGNGQMVQFGKAIDDYDATLKEKAKSTLTEPLRTGISEVLPEYSTFGADARGWFIDGFTTNVDDLSKIQDTFKSVLDGIDTSAASDIGETTGKNIASGLSKGIEDTSEDVNTAVSNMMEKDVKDVASDAVDSHSPSKWFEELAKWCGRGFRNGLDTGFVSAFHWFSKLGTRISNAIGSLYNIGWNAIIGMNNGMVAAASQHLYKNAQSIAQNVANKFRSVLKIHSPSQVFEEIGGFTLEGFQIGMQSMMPKLESTIQDVSNEIQKIQTPSADFISKNVSIQEVKSKMTAETDDFMDDIRKEVIAISSNTFDNNQMIAQAVKNALNGMAIYADGHLIGYLQEENQQFRNRNGFGLFEG